jgi:ribosome-associated toxin RatA of RatAB toxin-antitoxin module
MKSVKFSETIEINASVETVFDLTQDYGKRLTWDTFLKKAELIEGATEAAKGVKAFCVAKNGIGMETVYVSFNRPDVTAIKMTKGPFMFRSFAGSWQFKKIEEHKTEVIFRYSFSLRFPFNLLRSRIKENLRNNVKQRLIDLKHYVENQSLSR